MKHKLLFTVFFILLMQNCFSQTVVLDPTFGTGGIVVNSSITDGQVIEMQSNGKTVSCYLSNFSSSGNIHLTRFNSDGSVDTSFGVNGFVNTILFTEGGGFNIMKIQSNDKIIVTGCLFNLGNGGYNFATARYNSDGTLDTSFGVNGYAITDFGASNGDWSNTVEIQNDGALLIGGFVNQNSLDVAIVRYLSNGVLDTSFATNGKFTYNFGTNTIPFSSGLSGDEVRAIRVNSLGKIIVGISTDVNESWIDYTNFGFICLHQNGTLDTSFGNNGVKVVDFGDWDSLTNMQLTTDNKIIATGYHGYAVGGNSYAKIQLVKLLENGNYDTSFGNNGIVLTNRDSSNLSDISYDLCIQSDGKIICFGATPDPTNSRNNFLLIRFNINGSLDTTFNNVGYKSVDFNTSSAIGTSFLIQNDGKLLCAGSINQSSSVYVGCLARLQFDNLATNTLTNKSFTIYPNPFSESITIESKEVNLQNATLELYDSIGRKLSDFEIDSNNSTIQMDANLSKGNYFLKITNEGKSETVKIIKQ
jgi:uncharacterized delta-60 repeat protein